MVTIQTTRTSAPGCAGNRARPTSKILIAACDDCALVDAVCDAPVDLGAHPSLASGDLRFQYKAPVVMAGADMDDDCFESTCGRES